MVIYNGKLYNLDKTLLVWEKRVFPTGSVLDAPRKGRLIARRETCTAKEASIECYLINIFEFKIVNMVLLNKIFYLLQKGLFGNPDIKHNWFIILNIQHT